MVKLLYYAVYEAGDEYPVALYWGKDQAQEHVDKLPNWCDRNIVRVMIKLPRNPENHD